MPQIIINQRKAHLASYTFTRDIDQYKNTSISQLYQPPSTPFSQNTYHLLFSSCEYCKVFKSIFFIELLQKQSFADVLFFKIGVLKSFANFTGKYLCWSLFLKTCRMKVCNFIKKTKQYFSKHRFLDTCQCAFKRKGKWLTQKLLRKRLR